MNKTLQGNAREYSNQQRTKFFLEVFNRNIILLLASLFFYFYGEPKYILIMLISVFSAYIHGILIDKFREDGTEENEEVVKWQLIAMYYVSTVTDANMTSIVYSYIHEFSENIEAGEDIEISQAKAAYYVKEFLTKNLEQ